MRVVPKGLRAFDVEDADFFLTLVPGPRDRDGLPEAIRSWKRRIEERDPERTFSVGLALRAVGQRQVVAGQGRRAPAALSPGPRDLRRGFSRRDRGRHSRRAAA